MSHVKGSRGSRQSVTLCDEGGRILNFVTSHFKNSKAILHVSTKLKQFHWKTLHIERITLNGNKNNFRTAVLI